MRKTRWQCWGVWFAYGLAGFFVIGAVTFGQGTGFPNDSPQSTPWAEQVLSKMSLEERVGQMFQVRAYGDYSSFTDPDFLLVKKEIETYHIGSLDIGARMRGPNLLKGTPEQVAANVNELQRVSKVPLLVGADLERGLASRVADVPEFPMPMALGAISDPAIVEQQAMVIAAEARAVGIQWAFAPIADVNTNPSNPIIGIRSFGSDPQQVSDLVAAYIRGAHKSGMLVTVKHFPGEGDTTTDPHARATRIDANRKHLDLEELVPFRRSIAANVDAVMLAQAFVPAIDPDESKIATTSAPIVNGLLRRELGFKGIVITDALEMRGATALYPGESNVSGRIAVDAITAGADVLMLPRNLDAAYQAVIAAVHTGELTEERINQSVSRILEAKAKMGLNTSRMVDLDRVPVFFKDQGAYHFAQQIADDAVTLVRCNGALPFPEEIHSANDRVTKKQQNLVAVLFTDSRESPLGRNFEEELRRRAPTARVLHYYNDQIGSDAIAALLLPQLSSADSIVLAAFVTHIVPRELSRGGRLTSAIGFAGGGAQLFGQALAVNPKKTVVVALGSPYLIENYPEVVNYICTYSLAPTSEVSAAKALFGEVRNHATLPVDLPGVSPRAQALPWPPLLSTRATGQLH